MGGRSAKQLILLLISILLAYLLGNMVITGKYQYFFTFIFAAVVLVVGLTARLEWLLLITFYMLVAGSSYDSTLRNQTFYLRFGLFGLYILRAIPLFQRRDRQISAQTPLSNSPQAISPRFSMVHLILIFYCILAFLSTTYSIDPGTTLQRAAAITILFGAVFIYLYLYSADWSIIERLVKVMVLATYALLAVGYVFYLFGNQSAVQSTGRLRLFLFGPNELGYICAILFPAAFWFSAELRGKTRLYANIGTAMIAVTILLTASRGALLCFALATLLLVFIAYRKQLLLYSVLIFMTVSLAYIFAPPKSDRIMERFEEQVMRTETLSSGSGRIPIWRHGYELAMQRPWGGYGFGTVSTLFHQGYFSAVMGEFQGEYLHNSYLEVLLDLGYSGLLCILAVLATAFWYGAVTLRRHWHTPKRGFIAAVFCCVLAGSASAMFETWLTSPGSVYSFPFWYCVALLLRMSQFPQPTA